jgi:hypothetical protein
VLAHVRPRCNRLCPPLKDIVYDENGAILGGSLRALIKRLIPRRDYCPERSFIFALLLNIRTFVAPTDLLHQILQVSAAILLLNIFKPQLKPDKTG